MKLVIPKDHPIHSTSNGIVGTVQGPSTFTKWYPMSFKVSDTSTGDITSRLASKQSEPGQKFTPTRGVINNEMSPTEFNADL
ncbi:hypothetical protein T265_10109 [Opisthorchis viverrini]|uniref:Uncharacterized protein n=1 Tax=Opisthorchis viverrini TaxID=6198 RepID=A0A074ZEG8_OPIVI|nr:hypothetical protein T265_10109 [Opisthorchis viverrini]KER21615.1 hypothetical protein T265_10109 [Opisthorchis viverrini]